MDDMHPFERQVSAEVIREMRPSRPVDAAVVIAAVDAVRAPKWRFQSVFSATKFVIAGAIVALFGGFLLSGVLTQQPSDDRLPAVGASVPATTEAEPTEVMTSEPEPTTEVEADDSSTSDLLPGVDLLTEKVGPRVFQVLGDGAGHEPGRKVGIAIGPDGTVWLRDRTHDQIYALGRTGTAASGDFRSMDVAEDGKLWLGGDDAMWSYDGRTLTEHPVPGSRLEVKAIKAASDGSVWAWLSRRQDPLIGHFDDGEWTVYSKEDGIPFLTGATRWSAIEETADGTIWVASDGRAEFSARMEGGGLARFDGSEWRMAAPIPAGQHRKRRDLPVSDLSIGPEGDLFAFVLTGADKPGAGFRAYVTRFDGETWSVVPHGDYFGWSGARYGTFPDGRRVKFDFNEPAQMEVGPDGQIWLALPRVWVLRDDTWTRMPLQISGAREGIWGENFVLAPSGTLWAGASGLHVITPKAVAATEYIVEPEIDDVLDEDALMPA